jgi:hypothetical protein
MSARKPEGRDSAVAANMALQRTRGLAAAQFLWFAGRSTAAQDRFVSRSPLNAVALDGRYVGGGAHDRHCPRIPTPLVAS